MEQNQQPDKSAQISLSPGRLLPIAVLAAGLAAFVVFDMGHYLSLDLLRENREIFLRWAESHGILAGACFVGIYVLVVACSLPGGALLTIAGGFLFGPALTTLMVVIGATIGATVLFLAARYAFADYLRAKAGPGLRKMEDGFNEDAFSYLLVLRLVPLFPFWLVNLVPALLGMRLGSYILATAIGIIPGTVVFSMVGDGLGSVLEAGDGLDSGILFEPRFLLPVVGLALLALLPVVYKKVKVRAR